MVALGDVDELEIHGERSYDSPQLLYAHGVDPPPESLVQFGVVVEAQALAKDPDVLLGLEDFTTQHRRGQRGGRDRRGGLRVYGPQTPRSPLRRPLSLPRPPGENPFLQCHPGPGLLLLFWLFSWRMRAPKLFRGQSTGRCRKRI